MDDTDTRSLFDIDPDEGHEAHLDAEAMAAYHTGRVVPHARVREWLAKLAKGEPGAPPDA